ncbi:hypothetical protein K2X92_05205 [Candidatus Gracilibacteria bacterium]|nr:hypothetical protein [Candidatus Gracilibacteria bacterium]
MSEITPTSSSESPIQTREIQTNTTPETQEYISRDARLQKLSQEGDKSGEIARVVGTNSPILSQGDNIREQQRILGDTIPGYNQMTKDGREFSRLGQEDVDKLSRSEKKDYYKWKQALIDQGINNVKNEVERVIGEKVQKKTEVEGIIGEKVQKKTEVEGVIGEKVQKKTEVEGVIGEKAKIITEREELKTKLPAISKEVKNITAKLSANDKSTLSAALSQAKNGQDNNAAVLELKRLGVEDTDIKSGKYDSYISASIIIENASKFEAAKDPEFQKSIRALQSQGIPVRVQPDFSSVTDHIVERFAPGDRTNTAIANIRSGLMSKEFNGVHYDGIGDRYTLIGADGKTRKDIYMDKPPRAEIGMNGLSIGREIPPATPEDLKRQAIQEAYIKNYEKIGKLNINPIPSDIPGENEKISTLYSTIINIGLSPQDRITAIGNLRLLNGSRKDANIKKMLDGNTNPEPLNGKLEEEMRTIESLESIYREEVSLREQAKKIPNPPPDTFDEDAKKTIKYLSSIGYNELGQDLLEKVIAAINLRNQGKIEEINLSKNPKLNTSQEKELLTALARLSRKSGLMSTWQGMEGNDITNSVLQMNSPNWRTSLQDISKGVKFQTMKSASLDSFINYLYEKPQTETTKVEKPGEDQS